MNKYTMKIEYQSGNEVITISALQATTPYKLSYLGYPLKEALRSFANSYNDEFNTNRFKRFTA